MGLLRWVAPVVALAAALWLPALRVSAPVVGTADWTVAQLGAEAARAAHPPAEAQDSRPSLRSLLRQVESLRQEFGGRGQNARGLDWALALAGLIPVMALLAGLCALLALVWQGWRHPRLGQGTAVIGLLAAAYAIGASWLLTRTLQAEVAGLFERAQHSLGGLLRGLDLHSLQAGLGPLGVEPQAGLYVMELAFLAILLWPSDRRLD